METVYLDPNHFMTQQIMDTIQNNLQEKAELNLVTTLGAKLFAHEPCDGTPKDYNNIYDVQYSSSKKVGDSVQWTKDKKPINLN